jgi:hypothetical protein
VRRLAMALCLLVASCLLGSCSRHSSAPDATAKIRTTWAQFFTTKTSVANREKLLEDGVDFASTLNAQAQDGPISAVVDKVTLSDATHAAVSYSLSIGKSIRLNSVAGAAVLVNGKWLVSESTLCVVTAATGTPAAACS